MLEGWLLINLGSPERPTVPLVRTYLREFLMDRHVIDVPWALRVGLVHGLIAPVRAPKSAHAYRAIWTEHGSPLLENSREFAQRIAELFSPAPVELAMRYGRPTIAGALERLRQKGVKRLNVVPMYPQFAKSSTWTAIEVVLKETKKNGGGMDLRFLQSFFDQPEWIEALAENIRAENESFHSDFLLLSYHGLPEHHIRELDRSGRHCLTQSDCCLKPSSQTRYCYRSQCHATSRALLSRLSWPVDRFQVTFQSRLGRRPWIRPYTDHAVVEAAKQGRKRILVTCPSFVADCLETLEEIAIRLRADFIAAGGEDLRLVPAVNALDSWVNGFARMVRRSDLDWIDEAVARSSPLFT